MSFAENLQILRKRDKITQEELADFLQVSRQSISKWETGDTYPEIEKLIALCDKFDVTLDALVRGEIKPDADLKEELCEETTNVEYVCEYCSTAFFGNYCPNCGKPKASVRAPSRSPKSREKVKRTVDYIGFGFGILCALSCMVFVFFTGLNMKFSSALSDVIAELLGDTSKIDIYYFFGRAYENLAALEANNDFKIYYFAYYSPIILGTVISAVTLAATATFFILSTISAVRKFLRKGGEKFTLFSSLTFASYIFGVVAIS